MLLQNLSPNMTRHRYAILNALSLLPQKMGDQLIKSLRLVPLDPVSAAVEEMKFGVGNALKQFDPALHRDTAIIGSPQEQRFDTELIQLIVDRSLTRSVAPLQLSLVVLAGAHFIALADQLFGYQLFIEN